MDPPKPSAEEKSQNPGLVRCTNELNRDSIGETLKNNSEPSVFVNTEPIREDQVQNAVSFLSHPRVKGSPIIYRRSFLEKKGLTKDEIDEAFRRVPDPPPAVSSVQADGQLKPSSSAQPQTQNLQTSTVGPVGAPAQTSIVSRFHWSHAFYAIGLLAVSGAGTAVFFKNAFVPRLKSWIRMVVLEEENELVKKASKPSLAEEAAAAAKAAAVAASDVAKSNQDILSFKSEGRKYFEEFRSLLDVQVQEMKSMSNAIQQLEGQRKALERNFPIQRVDHKVSVMGSKPIANGKMDFDSSSVRSPLPPAPVESTAAPHPKSYMDIMAMIQRGEKPSNIREINDQPPNPYQPLSNPRLPPRPKPWELGSVQPSSNNVLPSQASASAEGFNPAAQQTNDLLPGVTENGDDSVPWLQQHKNVRIREIENGEELKTVSYGVPANERRIQQTWIPPQTPTVALPEAAAAIRHPKSTLPKEQLAIEPHLAHPNVGRDELQRITKLSKSGEEIDGGNLMPANLSELQDQE